MYRNSFIPLDSNGQIGFSRIFSDRGMMMVYSKMDYLPMQGSDDIDDMQEDLEDLEAQCKRPTKNHDLIRLPNPPSRNDNSLPRPVCDQCEEGFFDNVLEEHICKFRLENMDFYFCIKCHQSFSSEETAISHRNSGGSAGQNPLESWYNQLGEQAFMEMLISKTQESDEKK